ncbi:hypothetical protein CCACVL1_08440 [Corchorus capsularis]|uniref:Uncharacterized protein n=1 Tax=Corchorus capsularis TaxID=210143 RepID=A0A1R3J0K8_COCAP|nr:hypothetical protein CCACVL1_08440 [Corchorus capsularis]
MVANGVLGLGSGGIELSGLGLRKKKVEPGKKVLVE